MANSRFTIIMNYYATMRQVEKINSIIEEIGRCENKYAECDALLRSGWTGENAQRYLGVVAVSKENVGEIRRRLTNISNALSRMAKQTYRTELQALEISKDRNY